MLRRALCSVAGSARKLTLEQALTSTHMVLADLQSPASKQHLNSLRSSTDTLHKWQQTNSLLIHATLRMLPQIGFQPDATGLQAYTEAFADEMRSGAPEVREKLQQLNDTKWRVLLDEGYGCRPAPPFTLQEARNVAIAIVDALQEPEMIRQVEESRSGLGAHMSDLERQHMVARAVVGVQADVLAKHGFEGDQGFAQAQVALMQYAGDAVVTASVAAATTQFYARAGINLHEALKAATG